MPDPTVFSIPADGARGVRERRGYDTDLVRAYTSLEQRVQLRSLPSCAMEFGAVCVTAREAQLVQSLIFGAQAQAVAVPMWQYASELTANVNINDTAIITKVSLTNVPYLAGGYALVWQDAFTWELFSVVSASGFTITTSDLALAFWDRNKTLVYPVRLARLETRVPTDRLTSRASRARLRFLVENGQDEIVTAIVTVAFGFDVLETQTDRVRGIGDQYLRSAYLLDNGTGIRAADATFPAPAIARDMTWVAFTRAEVKALRAFIDARKGRAVPFWMPSWDDDMTLTAPVSAGVNVFTVQSMGYAANVFPAGPAHRYIYLLDGTTARFGKVTGAVDNGDGTETITLLNNLTADISPATTQISFLRLCRLDSDDVDIEWITGGIATARLSIVELPAEVPA